MLVKITVHSENLNFAMPCFFRYDNEISLSWKNFRYASEIPCIAKLLPLCF